VQIDNVITMKRTTKNDNELSYHHTRIVILLIAFTVLMAAITCLFAYLFDEISGFGKLQTMNRAHGNTRFNNFLHTRFSSYVNIEHSFLIFCIE
jgi:hypothetical protein